MNGDHLELPDLSLNYSDRVRQKVEQVYEREGFRSAVNFVEILMEHLEINAAHLVRTILSNELHGKGKR
jgi:hypothetical protein